MMTELPMAGMIRNGAIIALPEWESRGVPRKQKWPTPKHFRSGPDFARRGREGSGGDDLVTRVYSTTPGPINPDWVEWLMGFEVGYTTKGEKEVT